MFKLTQNILYCFVLEICLVQDLVKKPLFLKYISWLWTFKIHVFGAIMALKDRIFFNLRAKIRGSYPLLNSIFFTIKCIYDYNAVDIFNSSMFV